jgi:hypothetical protein
MTENYVNQVLTDAFLTLNASSNKPYIKFEDGKPVNVALPNVPFSPDSSKQFFVLSLLANEPDPAGMGTDAENRFDGVFQIDVYSPIGKGEDEMNAKYEALARLFERGKTFDEVIIQKVYCPLRETDDKLGVYRAVVRIEWTCDLPK